MSASKSFEDQFDHDPNDSYEEEEEELDLGPDDEFLDALPPKNRQKEQEKRLPPPRGGCLSGLLKVFLSLSLIAFCYFYLVNPEAFKNIQTKITGTFSSIGKDIEAPVLSLGDTMPIKQEQAGTMEISQQDTVPAIILQGAGVLPDFSTAAKQNPDLNSYLITANKITFNTLDTHHSLVKNMIAEWTGQTDEQKISEIIQMPYKRFFYRTSASLLSQTLLKQIGLTPVNTDKMIVQSPVHIMAAVYPHLKSAIAVKTNIQDQVRTIEPVSSFLIYVCNDNSECMASWDLLIDMLGAKKFSKRLEKAPETIYSGH